jgi:serine/threonine protein kinase
LKARAEESDSIEAALCSPRKIGVRELRGSVAKETEPTITRIGKYAVIDVIGAGGMGIVYRARDAALNRTVAIKMLKRSGASDAQTSQVEKFFNRELVATASLQHKNIVTVYESGEEDGDPYLVMECLEGEPVSRIVSERRPMPLVDKLDILVQVCMDSSMRTTGRHKSFIATSSPRT